MAMAAVLLAGCSGGDGSGGSGASGNGTGGSSATGGTSGVDPWADARQQCVDAINAYRAQIGVPAYTRWTAAEPCVDQHAEYDSTREAHAGFRDQICQPRASAEDECPGNYYDTVASIINDCLAAMWAEGPGGGHYDNMSSTNYTMVACGFYRTASGGIWGVQDFR
jgi:hypothetical protein